MTGPRLGVHASLRPAHSLTPLKRGFVGGLHRRGLPCRRHPSYAASTCCRFGTLTLRVHEFLQASHNFPDTGGLLRRAAVRAEKKTAGMAREILRFEKCLWTFVDVPGLEPTNNFGERCLRHAVMYRKTSFGTQSPEGSRFVERILTAVTSLKLQRRGVLSFLTDTLHAHRRRLPTPSLLPTSEAIQLANAA